MRKIKRRDFLKKASAGAIGIVVSSLSGCSVKTPSTQARKTAAGAKGGKLEVGEGVIDITPPIGTLLGGFHQEPGQDERLVTEIRHPCAIRALMLRQKGVQAVIVVADLCGAAAWFVKPLQKRIAREAGIPAENIRICATHTHSMPMLHYLRQWGGMTPPNPYIDFVSDCIVRAVKSAKEDLAPADLYVGKSRAEGASFNRTSETWKTDKKFTKQSTDGERWLDTTLHVLNFRRAKSKRQLLWYHFSAHPVCFRDTKAGPDWPGIVGDKATAGNALIPAFLQGHCGDVDVVGLDEEEAEKTSDIIYAAINDALSNAALVKTDRLRVISKTVNVPLDIEKLQKEMNQYRTNPEKCLNRNWLEGKHVWWDKRFADDWLKSMSKWDMNKTSIATPVSAIRLGEMGIVFHPSELYSYYGLEIRRDSPFENTVVVGFADQIIGYLGDPDSYKDYNGLGSYSAVTVPKIFDLPPFKPQSAREVTAELKKLLHKLT